MLAVAGLIVAARRGSAIANVRFHGSLCFDGSVSIGRFSDIFLFVESGSACLTCHGGAGRMVV